MSPFFYAKFNLPALLHLAKQIRDVSCSCDMSQQPLCGSSNWAVVLTFVDGVEWIFRCPQMYNDVSIQTASELLESEVATMKYIKVNSSIPVPEIFDYSSTSSNPMGIPFILMSKAPGIALSKFAWNAEPVNISHRKSLPSLGRTHKEKIMKQLGLLRARLSKLRFDKIGSLYIEGDEYHIKKCLSPALIWYTRDCLDEVSRGPFLSTKDFYESMLVTFLLHVKELSLEPHVFFAPLPKASEFETHSQYRSAVSRWSDYITVGNKVDHSSNRLDYCIAEHYLRDMLPSIDVPASTIPSEFANGYPLHHPDLSSSNIFVDEDFNISCIIDWAFCSTVPMPILLTTPSLPGPRDDIDSSSTPFFRSGFEHNTFDEQIWISAQRSWWFSRLVALDGLRDYHYFTELYTSIYKPKDIIDIPRLCKSARDEKMFRGLAAELRMEDCSVGEIAKHENDYFRVMKSSGKEAVARKLTLVSELNQGFVADKRLWRWLDEALDDN